MTDSLSIDSTSHTFADNQYYTVLSTYSYIIKKGTR